MAELPLNELILWAESPEEARVFLARATRANFSQKIDKIFVAKRSSTSRANDYVGGQYYKTSNTEAVTVYTDLITAPQSIRDLVQWCTCDIMLSWGDNPIAVLEDTTHIVRMNVYQRVPRLFKATILGVPSIALQGTRGLNFSKRGDCWGLHRYMRAFGSISKKYPDNGALPFYYIAGDKDRNEISVENEVFRYLEALVVGDVILAAAVRTAVSSHVEDIVKNGFKGNIAPDIPSIVVNAGEVIVNIGAKPDKKSWKEKGSGQMDPYIGMIAAAKYIYCYDNHGNKQKEMVVRFTYLPPKFWWFDGWEKSTSLYKTLAFEIADRVEFLGT